MATVEDFKVRVSVDGAAALDKLGSAAQNVSNKMNMLSSTILGVGFVSFIRGAMEAADRMVDLSDATGLSVASIKAFGESMRLAGGNSKNAEKSIMALYGAIEAAADGGLKQQEAFKKVGVSIQDLQNLSEADILQKTIEGLAKIPAGSERAAAATALLGRSFRGVEAQKFLDTLDPAKYAEFEANAKRAADTVERFENIFATLQQGALMAIDPIIKMMGDVELKADGAAKIITALGIAMGVAFGANVLANIISINKAIIGTAAAAGLLGKNPILRALAGVGLLALEGTAGMKAFDAAMEGVTKQQEALNKAVEDGQKAQNGKLQATNPQTGPANRKVIIAKSPEQKAAEEAQKRIQQIEAETARLRANITGDLLDEIAKIETQKTADIAKAKSDIYGKENLSRKLMDQEYLAKKTELELKAELEIAKLRADANKQAQEQIDGIKRSTEEKAKLLSLEMNSAGLSKQGVELEKALFEIEKQRAAALEQINKNKNLTGADRQRYIDEINAQADAQARLAAKQIEYQNSFEAGWARAFSSYMDNATNAAKMAENIFNAMTSNLNRAIDDFVDNGKFSFRDFTNSVLRDMVKIQMKAAAANILTAGGSLLSGLFSGRAIGGPVQANQPYVVGERGPELFVPATAGNIVPNNNMSSGTGGSTIVQYNISAVDALSFKQMIARDPTFLYAVAEQGRKSLPLTRR